MAGLATQADFQAGPFADLVRDFVSGEIDKLMLRASRSIESMCDRRLAPFTALPESHRLRGVPQDDQAQIGIAGMGDRAAVLGADRAASLGLLQTIRTCQLNQYPPIYEDLWTGAIVSASLVLPYGGTVTLDVTTIEYEADRGFVRFALGTFIPTGTAGKLTYSGGYSTVPDDLNEACIFEAARLALLQLNPQDDNIVEGKDLLGEVDRLTKPYVRGIG